MKLSGCKFPALSVFPEKKLEYMNVNILGRCKRCVQNNRSYFQLLLGTRGCCGPWACRLNTCGNSWREQLVSLPVYWLAAQFAVYMYFEVVSLKVNAEQRRGISVQSLYFDRPELDRPVVPYLLFATVFFFCRARLSASSPIPEHGGSNHCIYAPLWL